MNESPRTARRYHWHSATVRDFTADPHAAIVGQHAGTIMNLVDRRAKQANDARLTHAGAHTSHEPCVTIRRDNPYPQREDDGLLEMPTPHDVRAADVNAKLLGAV